MSLIEDNPVAKSYQSIQKDETRGRTHDVDEEMAKRDLSPKIADEKLHGTFSKHRFLVAGTVSTFLLIVAALNLYPHSINIAFTKPEKLAASVLSFSSVLSSTSSRTVAPEGCESTVLIVRHCEKDYAEEHCNYLGFERAEYLSTLFGTRWPKPSYLFATHKKRKNKNVYREIETLIPTAHKVNANITEVEGGYQRMGKTIKEMLQTGEMCGKVAVICWKHDEIPVVAQSMGCGPLEGCPMDYPSTTFDQAWEIKFVFGSAQKKIKSKSISKKMKINKSKWWVFGNVMHERFDPLEFSMKKGDYPEGGKEQGASWFQTKQYDIDVLEGMV